MFLPGVISIKFYAIHAGNRAGRRHVPAGSAHHPVDGVRALLPRVATQGYPGRAGNISGCALVRSPAARGHPTRPPVRRGDFARSGPFGRGLGGGTVDGLSSHVDKAGQDDELSSHPAGGHVPRQKSAGRQRTTSAARGVVRVSGRYRAPWSWGAPPATGLLHPRLRTDARPCHIATDDRKPIDPILTTPATTRRRTPSGLGRHPAWSRRSAGASTRLALPSATG